jgi:hypothetical protein
MNVFFDVQGTLVCGGIPRPHVREVFAELAGAGHDVYLWSSSGAGFAFAAAELLGVEDLVFRCYSKFAPPPVTVDYTVDDHPDVVERLGGYIPSPPLTATREIGSSGKWRSGSSSWLASAPARSRTSSDTRDRVGNTKGAGARRPGPFTS